MHLLKYSCSFGILSINEVGVLGPRCKGNSETEVLVCWTSALIQEEARSYTVSRQQSGIQERQCTNLHLTEGNEEVRQTEQAGIRQNQSRCKNSLSQEAKGIKKTLERSCKGATKTIWQGSGNDKFTRNKTSETN